MVVHIQICQRRHGNLLRNSSRSYVIKTSCFLFSNPMPIITKRVIAGNKNPSDFTISVTDNSPSPGSFAGSSSGTIVTLKAGTVKFRSRLYLVMLLHTHEDARVVLVEVKQ